MKITRAQLTDLFYLLVIAAVCFKLLYAVSHVMDIRFYDETSYLARGLDFNSDYLFKDGFIYFAWYKFLSFFAGDAVSLYYFNYAVLFVLNPLLLYLLLRKMGKSAFVGTLFAVFLAVSNLSIITWPFITRFTVTVILAMFLLIFSIRNKKAKYLVALGGLALLIYTRPEYVLSLVIFAIVSIVFLGYKFIKTRGRVFVTLSLVTLVL
ncbi:MAG: hypothetical protein GY950_23950, partial [bacterium]|nr:hypothetical protein [bacterium]